MPWKASSVMEERLRFVARLLDGEAMTDVCREFGVSRKTGYKILDRYKARGLEALSDRSRRPHRSEEAPGASGNCTALKRAADRGAVGNRQCKSTAVSITLGRTSLVPVQAKSLRSHALYLVIECVHFLSASRVLGFRRIGGAQFFQRFLDREFRCFGHGKPRIQARRVRPHSNLVGAPATVRNDAQASVDLDQQECAATICLTPDARRDHPAGEAPEGNRTALFRGAANTMNPLLREIRETPLLWMLIFVPAVLIAARVVPTDHTILFVLAVLAIVPLAALLSHATEAVSEKTGDAVGGLLNATLGNLTELIIAITALRAGEYMLVKASIAGAIVANSLFMLGASFLLGGLRYHVQEYNRAGGRMYSALLLMATVALLAPAAVSELDLARGEVMAQNLSAALAILLIVAYALSLLFSLKTHKELFASEDHGEAGEAKWPINLAIGTLLVVTVLVALVSEIFVESVQHAATTLGMSPAFVGFIIVALVGAAAEMAVAFSAARKNRLDMSVSIALGSASQIALFVAPVLVLLSYVVGPKPMDLQFWPGAVTMVMIATVTATFVTNSGRSAWFVGALLIFIYVIFAMTLYMVPPGSHGPA
jgi:Ca2+:H+ antiporter